MRRYYRNDDLECRFWHYVNKQGPIVRPDLGECWIWTSYINDGGYGCLTVNKKLIRMHRFSYFLHYGDPGQLCVLHKCDNRLCVRPNHLFLGTRADNMADCIAKNRRVSVVYPERVPRGETSGLAKLCNEDVIKIRQFVLDGMLQRDIAKLFNVTQSAISRIKNKDAWGHI